MHNRYDVIIVGGGLAGLSCAVELVDQGKNMLLLESREVLGGRTSSWVDKGMAVESGLHRFLGFYEALPNLLQHVGTDPDEILFWEDEIEIKMPDGQPSAIFGLSLHKPVKTIGGLLLNNDFIPPDQKLKISKFFSDGFIDLKQDEKKLDTKTVYNYAKEHDLSDETITRELVPLTEGLFFLSIRTYSARNLFALFSPYLPKIYKSRVGAFTGGMTDVMIMPLARYVKDHSGEIRTNSKVDDLILDGNSVVGVEVKGDVIRSSQVILASSLSGAQTILKKHYSKNDWFEPLLSLPSMPSVTFQIELTKPAFSLDRTTFSPTTIFSSYSEQSRTTYSNSKGRLSVILSEPEKYLKTSEKDILEIILSDAKRLSIDIKRDDIVDFRKVTWESDFYSYERGTYQLIPEQRSPIKGLTLAGDYTKQKYLQTMEGAVVSGQLAAQAIL